MSDYIRVYNLTIKDGLPTGNSNKVIKGTELDVELNAAAAAIASKADTNSPTFTGTPAAPTASAGTSTTQLATTAFVQTALQAIYPVGSIYINATVSTNPATLLGFGTWTAFGAGKVLVGQDTGDTLFDTLEETGGSKDAIVVSHTHGLTVSGTTSTNGSHDHSVNDPGHTHRIRHGGSSGGEWMAGWNGAGNDETYTTESRTTGISLNANGSHNHTVTSTGTSDSTGSSGTNANVQPFIVVKMWKRTA